MRKFNFLDYGIHIFISLLWFASIATYQSIIGLNFFTIFMYFLGIMTAGGAIGKFLHWNFIACLYDYENPDNRPVDWDDLPEKKEDNTITITNAELFLVTNT